MTVPGGSQGQRGQKRLKGAPRSSQFSLIRVPDCLSRSGMAAMAGRIAASTLHHCTLSPRFLLSTASPSSSSSNSSSSSLCSTSHYHHAWLSRPRCVTQRLSWTPAVARAASRGVAAVAAEEAHEEDEEEGGALSLYEEELGLEEEDEEQDASTGAKVKRTFRSLGNKEKKELRAYAHQLGHDICMHQVGKWGLTTNCITAISDALEANELVKIRVLDNLDEELADTVGQLEARTGAQIVGKMGRTLLLYRPSMRKLKAAQAAEEKAYKYQKRKNLLASRTKSSRSVPGSSRGTR